MGDIFSKRRDAGMTGNHDSQAEVFEQWQQFEMGWEGQPRALKLVGERIMSLEYFCESVRQAIDHEDDWLAHMAGTIFRLHGMSQEGEIQVHEASKHLLNTAVDVIVQHYEKNPPPNATYLAAVYEQALVAYAVAKSSGARTHQLAETIRRVGNAIVRVYEARGSQNKWRFDMIENLHKEYVLASQLEAWGSQRDDIVWNLFFAPAAVPYQQLARESPAPVATPNVVPPSQHQKNSPQQYAENGRMHSSRCLCCSMLWC